MTGQLNMIQFSMSWKEAHIAPVLAVSDRIEEMVVYSNASGIGLGCILIIMVKW